MQALIWEDNMTIILDPDELEVAADPIEAEALNGVPNLLDIPDEVEDKLRALVLRGERLFWMRSSLIVKDTANTTLLRRALYAEHRLNETEHMLAEMAMITQGASQTVKDLAAGIDPGEGVSSAIQGDDSETDASS